VRAGISDQAFQVRVSALSNVPTAPREGARPEVDDEAPHTNALNPSIPISVDDHQYGNRLFLVFFGPIRGGGEFKVRPRV